MSLFTTRRVFQFNFCKLNLQKFQAQRNLLVGSKTTVFEQLPNRKVIIGKDTRGLYQTASTRCIPPKGLGITLGLSALVAGAFGIIIYFSYLRDIKERKRVFEQKESYSKSGEHK